MRRPFDQELDRAELCVVAIGNPFDGLTLIGPFSNVEDANAYGENVRNHDWWVAPLTKRGVN